MSPSFTIEVLRLPPSVRPGDTVEAELRFMHNQRGGGEFTLNVQVLGTGHEQEIYSRTVEVAYREIYTETLDFAAPQSPQIYRIVATAASPAGEEIKSHEAPLIVA